jgi:hypothetical protein
VPGLGLAQPDCKVRVNDVYVLGAIHQSARPECSFAQIHERHDIERYRMYRPDLPLHSPCDAGNTSSHDESLGGHRWRILEITTRGAAVMNVCGEEEWLPAAAGMQPMAAARPASPAHRVEVAESNFGPGTVETYDDFERVVFTPADGSAPREYRRKPLAPNMPVYYPQQGDKIPYAPQDLANLLRVYLTGEQRGEPMPPREEEAIEDGFPL